MKQLLTVLLFFSLAFPACQKDKQSPTDLTSLQKKLDSDTEVEKARILFHEHTRILASFSREELASLFSKINSCGYYPATAPMQELEKCLAGYPNGEKYITCEKFLREYRNALQTVEHIYPELAQMETRQKMAMLFRPNEKNANELLSDYLNAKNKK